MDPKRLKTFAITHITSNVFLSAVCIYLIVQSKFKVDGMLHWFAFIFIFGLCATVITKRKLIDYFMALLITLPIVLPIIYTTMNGMFSGKIILFDALGFWFIHNQYQQLELIENEVRKNKGYGEEKEE
ncbi:hypothetical protein O0Q50_20185 [Priestia aryabhattai]|uniref:Uncharacterized protein n=1 Tax=Priestia aryabhattai TaxID=412384 RepID=A0AAX6NC83_PRIAR|nr:hypothetical protein [Priestia aryabhattai]MDU9693498.1 hypothetical protein [Priestia aryabhattai]